MRTSTTEPERRQDRITIVTTPEVIAGLRQLQETGFYGDSIEVTAEELLRHRLREIQEMVTRREHAQKAKERKANRGG